MQVRTGVKTKQVLVRRRRPSRAASRRGQTERRLQPPQKIRDAIARAVEIQPPRERIVISAAKRINPPYPNASFRRASCCTDKVEERKNTNRPISNARTISRKAAK